MVFFRQEYWSGLPFSFPVDLPESGMQPVSPAWSGRFFTTALPGKPDPWKEEKKSAPTLPEQSQEPHLAHSECHTLSWGGAPGRMLSSASPGAHPWYQAQLGPLEYLFFTQGQAEDPGQARVDKLRLCKRSEGVNSGSEHSKHRHAWAYHQPTLWCCWCWDHNWYIHHPFLHTPHSQPTFLLICFTFPELYPWGMRPWFLYPC